MNHLKSTITVILVICLAICIYSFRKITESPNDAYISYVVDLKKQQLKLYWKDDKNQPFKSLGNLKTWLSKQNQTLLFAMNAGMYQTDNSPLGLYIEDSKLVKAVNKRSASGNFYLKPNGIFYTTTDNIAVICKTADFAASSKVRYATQSGPMLLIDGKIHPDFTAGSKNVNIRNGVGILPNKTVIFAMSKTPVSFYDFAQYFKSLGCKNALYLDGFVCQTYLPAKQWLQTGGNFGVIVAVTAN